MDKPHLQLHIRWLEKYQCFVWFVRLPPDETGYRYPTSYKDTSAEAIKSAGDYYRG